MELSKNQRKVLNKILDRYENSKTYEGTNAVNQKFSVRPDKIWGKYYDDSASIDQVNDFEREMEELQSYGFVTLDNSAVEIHNITGNEDAFGELYRLLDRREKKDIFREYEEYFNYVTGEYSYYASEFALRQLEKVEKGHKLQYDFKICKNIVKILDFLEHNEDELLERELSIIIFGDSKTFEKSYRAKVCRHISETEEGCAIACEVSDENELDRVILESFNIYANPSYVYIKGNSSLQFENGSSMVIKNSPVALSSGQIKSLESIQVEGEKIVTVENLTSFHRVNEEDTFYIYLAGYHNRIKQKFIQKIGNENPGKNWYHFGDIDPDGFYIFENLKKRTGIDFKMLYMGIEELSAYKEYTKKLNGNDKTKAKNLIFMKEYEKVLKYMLSNDCKLEQEIVSLKKSFKI